MGRGVNGPQTLDHKDNNPLEWIFLFEKNNAHNIRYEHSNGEGNHIMRELAYPRTAYHTGSFAIGHQAVFKAVIPQVTVNNRTPKKPRHLTKK